MCQYQLSISCLSQVKKGEWEFGSFWSVREAEKAIREAGEAKTFLVPRDTASQAMKRPASGSQKGIRKKPSASGLSGLSGPSGHSISQQLTLLDAAAAGPEHRLCTKPGLGSPDARNAEVFGGQSVASCGAFSSQNNLERLLFIGEVSALSYDVE